MYGKETAVRLSVLLFGLMIALSFVPVVCGGLGWLYLAPVSLTDIVLVFFVIRLLKSQTPAEGRRAMRGLYLSASVGFLAFLVGSFFA